MTNRGVKPGTKRGPYKKKNKYLVVSKKVTTKSVEEATDFYSYLRGANPPKESKKKETMPIDIFEKEDFSGFEILNITGHAIVTRDGKQIPSVARIRVAEDSVVTGYVDGVPVYKPLVQRGVTPPMVAKRIYLVSIKLCQACPDRSDFFTSYQYAADRGNCLGIVRNPFYIYK